MSDTSPYSPEKNLPPVQPPTVGFLMKLFFIPGLIVTVIVLVWMLFNWLAHMGNDPAQELKTLRGTSATRWHAANNLASQLVGDQDGKLRGDPELCKQMADMLDAEVTAGSMLEDPLKVRMFLAVGLKYFTVDDGVPALIKAAKTRRELIELPVQAAAFDSLGVLTHRFAPADGNVAKAQWKYYPEVRDLALGFADDPEEELRERAAFHLAEFSEPAATEKLKKLLDDPKLEIHFNAGTSLAMRGDPAAIPVLEEMLRIRADDLLPKIPDGQEPTPNDLKMAAARRLLILKNGLDGVVNFRKAQPTTDLNALRPAIEALKADDNPELTKIVNDVLARVYDSAAKAQ